MREISQRGRKRESSQWVRGDMSGPLGLDEVRMKVEFQKNEAVGSRERASLQSAPRLNVSII